MNKRGASMTHDLLTNPLIYRLWRLRRLWLACFVLPGLALGMVHLMTGGDSVLLMPGVPQALAVLWAAMVTGLILRFPVAVIDHLAIAVTVALMVLILPLAEALVGMKRTTVMAGDLVWLGLLLLIVAFGLWLALTMLLHSAQLWGPRVNLRRTTRIFHDISPEAASTALSFTPGQSSPDRRCGPIDDTGFFDVWFTATDFVMPPAEGEDPDDTEDAAAPPDFRLCLLEQGPYHSITLTTLPNGATETCHTSVTPAGLGTRLVARTVHDALTIGMALNSWLRDFGRDYYTSEFDKATNRPPRAILRQPIDSPVIWLARHMPKNDGQAF